MSATSLASSRCTRVPVHVAFSPTSGSIVVLYPDAFVEIWEWTLSLSGKAKGAVEPPFLRRSFSVREGEADVYARQCACVGAGTELVVAVLVTESIGSRLALVGQNGEVRTVEVPGGAMRVVASGDGFLLEDKDGMIQEGDFNECSSPTCMLTVIVCSPFHCSRWRRRKPVRLGPHPRGVLPLGAPRLAPDLSHRDRSHAERANLRRRAPARLGRDLVHLHSRVPHFHHLRARCQVRPASRARERRRVHGVLGEPAQARGERRGHHQARRRARVAHRHRRTELDEPRAPDAPGEPRDGLSTTACAEDRAPGPGQVRSAPAAHRRLHN